jgi:hypothetical protein
MVAACRKGRGPSLLRCLRNGDLDRPAGVVDLQEAHKDHVAPEGLDTMAAEKITQQSVI